MCARWHRSALLSTVATARCSRAVVLILVRFLDKKISDVPFFAGWCTNTGRCFTGSSFGPTNGACSSSSWAWTSGSCPGATTVTSTVWIYYVVILGIKSSSRHLFLLITVCTGLAACTYPPSLSPPPPPRIIA